MAIYTQWITRQENMPERLLQAIEWWADRHEYWALVSFGDPYRSTLIGTNSLALKVLLETWENGGAPHTDALIRRQHRNVR